MNIEVVLNGTDENPFAQFGLKQNPFPQSVGAEFTAAVIRLQRLGGEPIPNTDYIRAILHDFNPEFVDLCCKLYKPG